MIRKTVVAAVGLAAVASSSLGLGLSNSAAAATADVTVDWVITQDWGTGFQGTVRVTNNTGSAIDPWSLTVPYGSAITSTWDASTTAVPGGYRFAGPNWSSRLLPGGTTTFGFLAKPAGTAWKVPGSCAIPGGSCQVLQAPAGASPTASPTAAPAPTPTPTVASTSTADLTVAIKVTSDWGTGRNVDLSVTNTGTAAITSWNLSLPWASSSVSMWNATGSVVGGTLSVTNASWNGRLAPGATATVGMTDTGAFTIPASCTSPAGSCQVVSSGIVMPTSLPTATATPTATPTPTATYVTKVDAYTGSRKVIAYYPAWATYARNYQVFDIPAQKLTTINYAFANISNGRCVLGDSYADTDKAFAGDSWDQGALRGNFNQLQILKAANPRLQTMISIGGWTWSQNFAVAAATETSRKAFASSCVAFMKQYGFDGIDIDWEYPVSGGLYPGTPADRSNYTALLQAFRTELDAQAKVDGGTHYALSIAAPAGPSIIPNLEVAKIGSILDWMNLMSYDFRGSWDPTTGHNAPLAAGPKDSLAGFNITSAVNTYLSSGFPAGKLILGVPFYGRGWSGVPATANGLYQPGTATGVGTWEKGVFDYSDIVANYLPKMTRFWDAEAQVPYLFDQAGGLWISYDDDQSMKAKADFVKAKGLGGAMVWEISGDRTYRLLDTLIANL